MHSNELLCEPTEISHVGNLQPHLHLVTPQETLGVITVGQSLKAASVEMVVGRTSPGPEDSLRLYQHETGRYPLLTKQEEVSLALRIRAGRMAEEQLGQQVNQDLPSIQRQELFDLVASADEATLKFVVSNLRLVTNMAKSKARTKNMGALEILDLIQEGNFGLIHAVKKFDPDKGFRFSTYATWWISQAIDRGVGNTNSPIRVSNRVRGDLDAAISAQSRLTDTLGRPPTVNELAFHLDQPYEYVVSLLIIPRNVLSVNRKLTEEAEATFEDVIADPKSTRGYEEAESRHIVQIDIAKALAKLSDLERIVVSKRFGILGEPEMELKDIDKQLGLPKDKASSISRRAYSKIRDILGPEYGNDIFS